VEEQIKLLYVYPYITFIAFQPELASKTRQDILIGKVMLSIAIITATRVQPVTEAIKWS